MQRAPVGGIFAFVATIAALSFADPVAPSSSTPTFGPPLGNVKYETKIQSADGTTPDVDDYVGVMLAGDVLSASVAAGKRSKLHPSLTLLGPDGADAGVQLKIPKSGLSAQFRNFVVPSAGPWTVRVSGVGATQGDYVVAFTVKPARPQSLRAHQLGGGRPNSAVEKFHGIDGATLDLKLTWTKGSSAVALQSIVDPQGGEVLAPDGKAAAGEAAVDAKHRTLSLSGLVLHSGDGDYSVRVAVASGTATYDATFALTPPGRANAGRKTIQVSALEPSLDAAPVPLRGRPGFSLHLTGQNFSVKPSPSVFLGVNAATVTGVGADGKSLDATVPAGTAGATVSVTVANPDGQAAVRGNYFTYLYPISVTDLVDGSGVPVRAASAEGGLQLHVIGANFESGQQVQLGGVSASVVQYVSSTEMIVLTAAAPEGDTHVVVTDAFGGIAISSFTVHLKASPAFDPFPYHPSVAAVNTAVVVTITGKNFQPDDQLAFAGVPVASTYVDSKTRTFALPAKPAGAYSVTLTDDIGTVKRGPDFTVKPPPTISSVAIVAGPHIGSTKIPVAGGTTIQVDGTNFHDTDAVTLGGNGVSFATHTTTSFTFVAPAGSPGDADLSIVDGAGQSATAAAAVRYVGYSDATTTRAPAPNAVDSLVAFRGAVGDLDNDSKVDDVVVVSSYYTYVGTRKELTRLYFGDASGKLVDVTATNFPAAGSDSSGSDNWNATAVALGDVDKSNGLDIVIAGQAPYTYYGGFYKGVRLFKNDGTGKFTQDEADAPPNAYTAGVYATDSTGAYFTVYSPVFESGYPTAMALGDLDKDGWPDLVVGRDHYEFRYVGVDPTTVDFTKTPPYVQSSPPTYLSIFQYHSATKVFKNDFAHGNGFVDKTAAWMPSAGDSSVPPTACFQARDLVLGDVDGDGSLDIVETWDDPTTVSAFGTYMGSNVDSPRIATRVLINNGSGVFTDATSSWMPAGNAPEFWQGSRLALADLDKDGKPDLVVLHVQGVDAYNTNPPAHARTALRVLRNGGPGVGFVDVTATAIPALPGNGDDFRGAALAVRDVDGDGWPDIVVGTTEALLDGSGNVVHRTRLFRGGPGLVFTPDTGFLPSEQADSGEAADILFVGDLSGHPDPSAVLLTDTAPQHSTGGANLRVFDWNR